MRRLWTILVCCAAAGCQSITIPTPMGPATAKSFGQRTTISQLHWSTNGVLSLKGYNNDQVTALIEALQAAIALGKSAAVP